MITSSLALLLIPAVQGPEVLITEGLPVPGNPVQTVDFINNSAVNTVGGWAFTANVTDPVAGTVSLAFGSAGPGPGATLREEGTFGNLQQTSFESFFGIDNFGRVSYSPSSDDLISGITGLDGVWRDSTVVANEGDPILSLPGKVFRFNSRPNITAGGDPVWIGGINDISGTTEGNAVFFGLSQTVIVKENDVLPGMPFALSAGGSVDFDFRFSPNGLHHILPVDLAAPSSTEDIFIDYDGAALMIGGLIVGEDQPMPAALQVEAGENWDNFDFFGVSDDGSYLFTGDTTGSTTLDELVVIDGDVVLREGTVLGGRAISGSIEGAYLSGREDWAVVWDVEDPIAGNIEVLIFNGRIVLEEGQTITTDLTGDGVPEVGTLRDFTGISALTVGIDRAAYCTVDLDYLGTTSTTDDVEVGIRLEILDLMADVDSVSVTTGGTVQFQLFKPMEVSADLYLLLGSVSGTSPGLTVDGNNLPLNVDSYFLQTLQFPNAAPLSGSLGTFDASGTAAASFTLPPAIAGALVGVTVHHAYAAIDTGLGLVTHTSVAAPLTLAP